MDIQAIAGYGALAVAGLLTIVEVTPIQLDPWSTLAKWIGKKLNADITEKVTKQADALEDIKQQTTELSDQLEKKDAEDARNHILRFGDEVKNKVRHSEEYFNQILDDITKYEKYCDNHPQFQNAKTTVTKEIIKEVYAKCVRENDFL